MNTLQRSCSVHRQLRAIHPGEALFTNHRGTPRFQAYSAGSHPTRRVNPVALEQLVSLDFPWSELTQRKRDEFAEPDAPRWSLF